MLDFSSSQKLSSAINANTATHLRKIAAELAKIYPTPQPSLKFTTPFELLVATILSAQCTDEKVNRVTPELFRRYPTPQKLARAHCATVERIIKTLGLFRNKSKNLIAMAQALLTLYDGRVPPTIAELIKLAGVGRKTANCVLVNAFQLPGVMVDTHCLRLLKRWGICDHAAPEKVEATVKQLLPPSQWGKFSARVILFGRAVCTARRPLCATCALRNLCPATA